MNKRIIVLVMLMSVAFTGAISALVYNKYRLHKNEYMSAPFMQAVTDISIEDKQAREILLKYSHEMNEIKAPSKRKKYFIHYTSIIEYVYGSGNPPVTNDVRIYMGANVMYYESNVLSCYQDSTETYTIIHPQKTIVKGRSVRKETASRKNNLVVPLQDSLYKNATILSSSQTEYQGVPVKRIEISPDKNMQKRLGVERVVYYYNEKENKMEAQQMWYNKQSHVLCSTFVFHEMTFHYKGGIKKHSREYVFDHHGLKKEWKGYVLENNN